MKFCLFDAGFLIIYERIKCVSHSLQSWLPAQILSALINAVYLNSSKMFMIVTLSSYINVQF